MRRGFGFGVAILAVVIAVGIGVGAYHWGYDQGLAANGSVEVVRYAGGHWGFPFGLILFPLFLFGIFALARGAFWRGPWHDHDHHGPWTPGAGGPGRGGPGAAMFEDWHRRQHEPAQGEGGSSGGEPSGAV
jgi:hypothetical protein